MRDARPTTQGLLVFPSLFEHLVPVLRSQMRPDRQTDTGSELTRAGSLRSIASQGGGAPCVLGEGGAPLRDFFPSAHPLPPLTPQTSVSQAPTAQRHL